MPVTGLYMAHRVQHTTIPYVKAYGQAVLENVIPSFENLPQRADAIASAEFKRLGQHPAREDWDGDMSVAAEAAQTKGQAFYDTMTAIRQSSLNLFASGLFHLLEQQLVDLCRDGAFCTPPPKDTKLSVVTKWYIDHFNLDLTKLPAGPKIEQLRLLANSVKHGEGDSVEKLRIIRPDLFQDPKIRDLLPDFPEIYTAWAVHLPMAGEDIFVTTQIFDDFSQAANAFGEEIAEYFIAHQGEYFLVND